MLSGHVPAASRSSHPLKYHVTLDHVFVSCARHFQSTGEHIGALDASQNEAVGGSVVRLHVSDIIF